MEPVEIPSIPVKKYTKDKEVSRDECIGHLNRLPALNVEKSQLIDIINNFSEKELIGMLIKHYKEGYPENISVKCGTHIRRLYNELIQ